MQDLIGFVKGSSELEGLTLERVEKEGDGVRLRFSGGKSLLIETGWEVGIVGGEDQPTLEFSIGS